MRNQGRLVLTFAWTYRDILLSEVQFSQNLLETALRESVLRVQWLSIEEWKFFNIHLCLSHQNCFQALT